jgi:hypothetical protein
MTFAPGTDDALTALEQRDHARRRNRKSGVVADA